MCPPRWVCREGGRPGGGRCLLALPGGLPIAPRRGCGPATGRPGRARCFARGRFAGEIRGRRPAQHQGRVQKISARPDQAARLRARPRGAGWNAGKDQPADTHPTAISRQHHQGWEHAASSARSTPHVTALSSAVPTGQLAHSLFNRRTGQPRRPCHLRTGDAARCRQSTSRTTVK